MIILLNAQRNLLKGIYKQTIMMNFNQEFENESFGAIDAGEYELKIARLQKMISKTSGKPYLRIAFVVRDDVDQPAKGRWIWDSMFLDSNSDNADKGWFDVVKTKKLLLTQPSGTMQFETPDELLVYLQGICLRATVATNFNDATGKDENSIVKDSFAVSNFPAKTDTITSRNIQDIPDEEVPF